MSDLCLITTCMGRLQHLRESLSAAASQPRTSCVVVDYSCPERCGEWVEQHYPKVRVVRVPGESYFSVARARNAGAAVADASWLGFFDADVILTPSFAETVLGLVKPGCFYRPSRPSANDLWGTMVCPSTAFKRIGGYDEAIQGWATEDTELYERFRMLGLTEETFPAQLLSAIPHSDELRTQFHKNKQIKVGWTTNILYTQAKLDLVKMNERPLSLDKRQKLYALVTDLVQRALAGDESARELHVAFRRRELPTGGIVRAWLSYTLDPAKPGAAEPAVKRREESGGRSVPAARRSTGQA